MKTFNRLLLGFTAGLVAGAFIRLGTEVAIDRPCSPGGEVLILPLIFLLLSLGYALGRDKAAAEAYRTGYRKGRQLRKEVDSNEKIDKGRAEFCSEISQSTPCIPAQKSTGRR